MGQRVWGMIVALVVVQAAVTAAPPPEAVKQYEAGLAAKKAGKLDVAAEALRQAVALDAEYLDAHWALAWVAAARQDVPTAWQEFRVVLRLAPGSDRAAEAAAAISRLGYPDPEPDNRPVLVPQVWQGRVSRLAWSPDGRQLAVIAGQTVQLLDSQTAGCRQVLPFTCQGLYEVAFSPDGRYLAASGGGRPQVWDLQARVRRDVQWSMPGLLRVAFTADSRSLVVGGDDSDLRTFDPATGGPLSTLTGSGDSRTKSLVASPDGRWIARGGTFGEDHLQLVDAASGQLSKRRFVFPGLRYNVPGKGFQTLQTTAVAFSRDSKTVAACCGDGKLRLWDTATGELRGEPFQVERDELQSVVFSPDGKSLAAGAPGHGQLLIWSLADHGSQDPFETAMGTGELQLAYSPDGATLAVSIAARDGAMAVQLWDVAKRAVRASAGLATTSAIQALAFEPGGRTLVVASADARLQRWDMTKGEPLGDGLAGPVGQTMVLSPDGRTIAYTTGRNELQLWDVAAAQPRGAVLSGHKSNIGCLAFSGDSRILATGSYDKSVRLWDVATASAKGDPLAHPSAPVAAVALSADGRTLATAAQDRIIRFWDTSTGQTIARDLQGREPGHVRSLAFSPDGLLLSEGVRLWDTTTARDAPAMAALEATEKARRATLPGVTRFSPDGRTLARAESGLELWDVATGRLRSDLSTGPIAAMAVSPDSRLVATAGPGGNIRIWAAASGRLLLTACAAGSGSSWLSWTPDGNYTGSADAASLVRWRVGDRLVPASEFEAERRRPEAIAASLAE